MFAVVYLSKDACAAGTLDYVTILCAELARLNKCLNNPVGKGAKVSTGRAISKGRYVPTKTVVKPAAGTAGKKE